MVAQNMIELLIGLKALPIETKVSLLTGRDCIDEFDVKYSIKDKVCRQ